MKKIGKIFVESFLFIFFIIHLSFAKEKFFPIGIYSVNPPQDFKEIKSAGFNVVHTYEFGLDYLDKYIKEAKNSGLKVLIFPSSRIGMRDYNQDKIKDFVNKYKDDNTILAWYLVEEPKYQNIKKDGIEKLNQLIKEIDKKHLTSIFVSQPDYVLNYCDGVNIVMTGTYPVPDRQLIEVAKVIEKVKSASRPIWAVIQVFGYQDKEHKAWGWKREPNLKEMKVMSYLAIAHGAKGLFFYTYHGSQYYIKLSEKHWRELKLLVKELRKNIPIFSAKKVEVDIRNKNKKYKNYIARIKDSKLVIFLINPYAKILKLKYKIKEEEQMITLSPYEIKKIVKKEDEAR
jgi:hypothetical protein